MRLVEPPVQHISRGKDRRSEVVLFVWPGGRADESTDDKMYRWWQGQAG